MSVAEEYPDSGKPGRVAASSETRHELASRRESMKSGLGTGILILSPVFLSPFSLEITSGASRSRSVDGGGINDNDGGDDDEDKP